MLWFSGDVNDIDVGDEVSYSVIRKGPKSSAEEVSKLPKGTIVVEVQVYFNLSVQ